MKMETFISTLKLIKMNPDNVEKQVFSKEEVTKVLNTYENNNVLENENNSVKNSDNHKKKLFTSHNSSQISMNHKILEGGDIILYLTT